ncbi:PadR family transcriptional regulator, partial [Clostridium sp.]|uniref:PadR family transcriptional regulator n=1 Tax=Clostridium sp. TaxID=1506 RepID=UPI0026394787
IEEKHGYLIMKTIENLTNNEVTIGPASLYTTLKKLLSADLVELSSDIDENKKVYKITNKGREMLIKEVERKKQMIKFAENFLN